MTKFIKIFHYRYIFPATLIFSGLVLIFLAPYAAVNVDEQLHYPHAKKVVNWYFTGGNDDSCLDTPKTNLKYYGQSVDNFTALVNRVFKVEDEFLVRHYTGALFFWLLLLFTGLIVKRITGSQIAASLVIFTLIFMPRLSGQAFGNLKDIPFAAGYMAGIFYIIKYIEEIPWPKWLTAMLLAFAIAFTVSVRSGGLLLFPYLAAGLLCFFVLYPYLIKDILSNSNLIIRIFLQAFIILVVGYFGGLVFWPYALQNVLVNPVESLGLMEHYAVSIKQLFDGKIIWSTDLPWYYLPVWMLLSTPPFIFAGSAVFIILFISGICKWGLRKSSFYEGFILFSFLFPFLYVIVIGSNLYSGVRQMLFIMPPLAVISILGIYKFLKILYLKNRIITCIMTILFIGIMVWPLKHQIMTFPVDYVYFNGLSGYSRNAWGNYEYDYYFHGIKEPADYLIRLADGDNITVAMNSNLSNYFENYPNIRYKYTRFLERSSVDWDYGIFGLNYVHPWLLKNDTWRPEGIIKVFYHKGNPVSVLIKRVDNKDFYGISEIKSGNLSAVSILENAIKTDTNNVWLYVQLAQAGLLEGDREKFFFYIEKGKQIHPYYEPFFLLEAGQLYKEGKYNDAMEKLEMLLEINPRYLPAKELYDDLKRMSNN